MSTYVRIHGWRSAVDGRQSTEAIERNLVNEDESQFIRVMLEFTLSTVDSRRSTGKSNRDAPRVSNSLPALQWFRGVHAIRIADFLTGVRILLRGWRPG